MQTRLNNLLKTLGPGIIFAGMCIGVSHLVQSTRAGADYGFSLLIFVIAANLFKYPFFEFSSRYTAATGRSILDGYAKVGIWILWVYGAVTFMSMFIVTATVTFVAAGLLSNLMGLNVSTDLWAALIFFLCVVLLSTGKYNALDGLLKVVSTVLLFSTLTAATIAFINGRVPMAEEFVPKEVLAPEGIIFLIALMGWMPTAVDMSTWTGLWAEARMKQTGYRPTKKETLLDFNLGYGITALLAIVFLSLGALVLFGTGITLSNSSAAFAGQLIGMYTSSIGEWSYIIIAAAAFSTMFSTSITVLDGYGRSMERLQMLLSGKSRRWSYTMWIGVVTIGAYVVISQFLNDLKSLVDLATILSFVIAPLAAYLNYRVILSRDVTNDFQPPYWLKLLAQAGLVFLTLFTLIYFGELLF